MRGRFCSGNSRRSRPTTRAVAAGRKEVGNRRGFQELNVAVGSRVPAGVARVRRRGHAGYLVVS